MNRSARRRTARRRPASRTLARFGLMAALPGASILAATAGSGALPLAAGDHHHDRLDALREQLPPPIIAMRAIIKRELAAEEAEATTTTTEAPPPVAPATTSPPAPATEIAASAPRVAPPPRPAPAPKPVTAPVAPKPAPAPAPAPPPVRAGGILPPSNPPTSIAPNPPFESTCLSAGAMSPACLTATLQATDSARATEGLGPLQLPGDYSSLTAAEQLFVVADTERVDRGLPPAAGLVDELDTDAQNAAEADTDPTPSLVPAGVGILRWASNWGENVGALGSNYDWMYDDGPGSGNEACGSGGGGCWGHRDNILGSAAGGTLVMGAGQAEPPAASPWMSNTELFAVITGHPAYYVYTWAQAVAAGAG